jgi:predicted secreted Zn-dependent protease
LQVHDTGFRAEYACVVTLSYHGTADALTVLRAIASRYRVDLVTLAELEQAASRHGSPLPDDLRPAAAA